MKKINIKLIASFISLLILGALIFPVISFAADEAGTGLIRCGNATTTDASGKTIFTNPCDFNALISLFNRAVNWIIGLAGVIFTISAVYGGFLYIISGDNPGVKSKAVGILWNTLK